MITWVWSARLVKKLDLAENTRHCEGGFEGAMKTLTRWFLCDVAWCYLPRRGPPGPLAIGLRFRTDRILSPYAGVSAVVALTDRKPEMSVPGETRIGSVAPARCCACFTGVAGISQSEGHPQRELHLAGVLSVVRI